MPEGPECRLTVDYLNQALQGKKIQDWVFCGGRYTDEPPEGFEEFNLSGLQLVKEVSCKGKFIYFTLEDAEGKPHFILHSLMMTGSWQKKYDDFSKWFVELEDGTTIWFRDPRNFATLRFTTDPDVLSTKLAGLGPDIMGTTIRLKDFKDLATKYGGRNITSFLMNQGVISGCGNYLKAEVLYHAKVSPLRKTGDLTERELELVYEGLRVISRKSYNQKGLSLRDYTDENGKKGSYGHKLCIYGKKHAKRTRTADGRTTYWDPNKQF